MTEKLTERKEVRLTTAHNEALHTVAKQCGKSEGFVIRLALEKLFRSLKIGNFKLWK